MTDVERLAEKFAYESYDIDSVCRLVIQPKSVLDEFRTVKYGFLFIIRRSVRIGVNGTIYELLPGLVFHAAPGMQMEARVTSETELEYCSVFYSLDKRCAEDNNHECNSHFKFEPEAVPKVLELLGMLHQNAHTPEGIGKLRVKELFLSIMYQVLAGHNPLGRRQFYEIAKVIDDWAIKTSLEKLPSITADYVFVIYRGSIDNAQDFAKLSAASIEVEIMQVYHAAACLVIRTRSHESRISCGFFCFYGNKRQRGQALTSAATTIFEKTGADRPVTALL